MLQNWSMVSPVLVLVVNQVNLSRWIAAASASGQLDSAELEPFACFFQDFQTSCHCSASCYSNFQDQHFQRLESDRDRLLAVALGAV